MTIGKGVITAIAPPRIAHLDVTRASRGDSDTQYCVDMAADKPLNFILTAALTRPLFAPADHLRRTDRDELTGCQRVLDLVIDFKLSIGILRGPRRAREVMLQIGQERRNQIVVQ